MKIHESKTHTWHVEYAYSPTTGAPQRYGLFRQRKSLFNWRQSPTLVPRNFVGHFNSEAAALAAAKHDEEHL